MIDIKVVAYHEAAHYVIAHVHGFGPTSISVLQHDTYYGIVKCRMSYRDRIDQDYLGCVSMTLAGGVAVYLLDSAAPNLGWQADIRECYGQLARRGVGYESILNALPAALEEVQSHWGSICGLADAVLLSGRLTSPRATAIINDNMNTERLLTADRNATTILLRHAEMALRGE